MNANTLSQISAYKNPQIVDRLSRANNLDSSEAELLFEDTKKYLYLCAKYPGKMIPTRALDDGWHNFILFTEDYANFCKENFGRYIHHRPTSPQDSIAERQKIAYQRTLNTAKTEFGESLSIFWTSSNPACCESPDGGTTNCQDPKVLKSPSDVD